MTQQQTILLPRQEMQVSVPVSGKSQEEEMAARSSILTWKIPLIEEPGGLHSPWGCKELDTI